MQRQEFEVSMLEQQPARSVFQDVTPADPGYAQLAGLIRQRTQQIELGVAALRHAGFPSASGSRRCAERRDKGAEFLFAPFAAILFALERNHAHFLSAPNSSRYNSGS